MNYFLNLFIIFSFSISLFSCGKKLKNEDQIPPIKNNVTENFKSIFSSWSSAEKIMQSDKSEEDLLVSNYELTQNQNGENQIVIVTQNLGNEVSFCELITKIDGNQNKLNLIVEKATLLNSNDIKLKNKCQKFNEFPSNKLSLTRVNGKSLSICNQANFCASLN